MRTAQPRSLARWSATGLLSSVSALALGAGSFGGCASSPAAPPAAAAAPTPAPAVDDPHLWLEDVTGEKPLAWVREQNAVAQRELEAVEGFAVLRGRLRGIYDSPAKIPFVRALGTHLYNFWKDEAHPRGLYRRTTLAEYKKKAPHWEVVIDVDALAKAENESWVWHGASCLPPAYQRCLVQLSRGGADADVVREFDQKAKRFVDGGFALPEAKSSVAWKDEDTLYVGTDFGAGSMTDSGYPRIVKEWKRGTPLTAATTIFEGKTTDVIVNGYREFDHGKVRDWIVRALSFFSNETFLREGEQLARIEKPDDADVDAWNDQILVRLRSDWKIEETTWPAGSLLAMPLADFRAGKRGFHALFTPSAHSSLDTYSTTKTAILTAELEDVKSTLAVHKPLKQGSAKQGFSRQKVDIAAASAVTATGYDENESDDYWLTEEGFTTPVTYSLGNVNRPKREALKQAPRFFEADGVEVTQHFATSKDGTKVPYFEIANEGLKADGQAPTVLEGYGGFEVSLTPGYDATVGAAWIERGGVYVVANIRGGGEYGPAWHQAALKENRQRAYDDFIAVAEDLIARKVTSTPKLGIIGGSNGGLLMGVMLTQRPDLFGAIVCEVPLLDMKRYSKLLAGASWMEEYGDPDQPAAWAALSKFSPYQNVKQGTAYPRTLFMTSTRDDRVHPGHARKMVARLQEQGTDLLYFENVEGGHGGAANNEQRAYMKSLAYAFFAEQLGVAPKPSLPAAAPAEPAAAASTPPRAAH